MKIPRRHRVCSRNDYNWSEPILSSPDRFIGSFITESSVRNCCGKVVKTYLGMRVDFGELTVCFHSESL